MRSKLKALVFFITVFVILNISVEIRAASAGFTFDIIPSMFIKSFTSKNEARELVAKKYPDAANDMLALLENKYKRLPARIHEMAHEAVCAEDKTGKLKILKAGLEFFQKNYKGALTKFVEAISEDVLKKYPDIVEELITKAEESGKQVAAGGNLTDFSNFKKHGESLKNAFRQKHSASMEKIKNIMTSNFHKLPKERIILFFSDIKAIVSEKYPDFKETAMAVAEKHPHIKKPLAALIAASKKPEFLCAIVKTVDEKYMDMFFEYSKNVINDLIAAPEIDIFAMKKDVHELAASKDPDIFFKIAKIKIEMKNKMEKYTAEKYPGLAAKVAKDLDAAFPGICRGAFEVLSKEKPGAVNNLIKNIRGEFKDLETDIDNLLKNKYPKLLEEIMSK